ncbi:MAG: universal stress protein [Thaumarchaeota archaeon]|nr:universal stress protein [Nitrososphaerota archaeon]
MIKNILVPVDGSKYSVKAFNAALDIAKKYGAKISILTCLENISA